jgi:hypothetical protein
MPLHIEMEEVTYLSIRRVWLTDKVVSIICLWALASFPRGSYFLKNYIHHTACQKNSFGKVLTSACYVIF